MNTSTATEDEVSTEPLCKFKFAQYGKAELFRAACKRRGVTATQDFDVVYVPEGDVDHVRQLARRYGLRSIDGVPAL